MFSHSSSESWSAIASLLTSASRRLWSNHGNVGSDYSGSNSTMLLLQSPALDSSSSSSSTSSFWFRSSDTTSTTVDTSSSVSTKSSSSGGSGGMEGGKRGGDGAIIDRRDTGSSGSTKDKQETEDILVALAVEVLSAVVVSVAAGFLLKWVLKSMPSSSNLPGSEEEDQIGRVAETRLHALIEKSRGVSAKDIPPLTSYERQIAQDVIDPSQINVQFQQIGGLDQTKQEIWELAVLPLLKPELFATSHLLQAPKGILLYGPPGTGKTMLAKAIAREADATFLAVKLSKIMNKWFGESNKLIDAIFSLANKLAPSIIFIDELDTFLNPRDGTEGSAGNAIKAEFLTLWDGITTGSNTTSSANRGHNGDDDETVHYPPPVMVIGATNRPGHVDGAILRRLPRQFRIELPDKAGRLQILQLTLEGHPMTREAVAFLPQLAARTVRYSGSDLKELCQCAALESIREVIREESKKAVSTNQQRKKKTGNNNKKKANKKSKTATNQTTVEADDNRGSNADNVDGKESGKARTVRPMTPQDFDVALTKVKRTGEDAANYERSQFEREHPVSSQRRNQQQQDQQQPILDPYMLQQMLMAFLQQQQQQQRADISPMMNGGGNGDDDDDGNNNGEVDEIPDIN